MRRLLTLIPARTWNRLLAGMVILLLLVVAAGVFYENARFDAFIKGQINIDHARIDANGLTLAQAERDIARVLSTDRADIAALQQKVAALQAQDAQLEAQIAALQAALGSQAQPPSISGNGGTAPPTSPGRPSSKPTPTPHPPHVPATPVATPVCISVVCLGPQQQGAQRHCIHRCTENLP